MPEPTSSHSHSSSAQRTIRMEAAAVGALEQRTLNVAWVVYTDLGRQFFKRADLYRTHDVSSMISWLLISMPSRPLMSFIASSNASAESLAS